ncbi:MAG: hypothetical protein US76_00825 [Parcubacteria group bacterium GW2011_GWA2_38_13b]|nr:MAG: hypothetical protein US76_00825 [Parcubacteria group bacterium GW2011_GWA2_38_13b]
MINRKNNLKRDLEIIIFSIIIAVILVQTEILKDLLISVQEWRFLGSLLAGIFFVSIFTVAPSAVILVEIMQSNPIWEVALFGGIGALIGDLLIFSFIKESLTEDIKLIINKNKYERLISIFHLKFFRWFVPFIGALVVASPLPDEIGLAMMGLSKMKTVIFIPISFILNFLGILVIGLIAKGLM